ncbi:ANTAR domain-containing protein [Geodermatophilus sp. URMC 64]
MSTRSERTSAAAACPDLAGLTGDGAPAVAVVRTSRGWSVVSPGGSDPVASLLEGLSLADLVAEALGNQPEPDRTARRSARGPAAAETDAEDPRDARIAALERTVAQLEHALAARVSTERAIGVLAERQGISPRAAFESLRTSARSSGRPVHELAREVLDTLTDGPAAAETRVSERATAAPGVVVAGVPVTPGPRPRSSFSRRVEHTRTRQGAAPGASGDGRS